MTTCTDTIPLTIPLALAPLSLSKNGRAHWRTRNRDFQAQKQWATHSISDQIACEELDTDAWPWDSAMMHIEWQYHTGRPPDDDNAVARLAAVRDAFQGVGVVDDDRHIRIGSVTFTRIPRSDEPCAVVTLERV